MPMNTTLLNRPGPPATSPRSIIAAAMRTCSRISPVDMFRVNPNWPVAQKGHPMPQPTCDEMHNVVRFG